MGKGPKFKQRPLSDEELSLIRQQDTYLKSLQPSIDKLINRGTALLDDTIIPDWNSIYSQTVNDIEGLRREQASLATGQLPQAYANAKMNYFNNIYENTMGKQLANMARSGIVDSSRLTSTTNDMQKNMLSQMSKDYSDDIKTQSGLLDQKYKFATSPLDIAGKANEYSFNPAKQHLGLAMGQGQQISSGLNGLGNLQSSRTTVTQGSGGFLGGLLSSGLSAGIMAFCFPSDVEVETDYGFVPIDEVNVDDVLVSKDGIERVVEVVDTGERQTYIVATNNTWTRTTESQPFVTREGTKPLSELSIGDEVLTDEGFEVLTEITPHKVEHTYELVVTGSALFYADHFCVEGYKENEV